MGSSSSKVVKTASSTARRYPATSSILKSANPPPPDSFSSESRPGPTVHPKTTAYASRDQQVDLDARDPDFGSRLSQLGPVQPFPTASNSSTFAPTPQVVKSSSSSASTSSPSTRQQIFPSASSNPALVIVQARDQIARCLSRSRRAWGGKVSRAGRSSVRRKSRLC